ncbi:MAG: helix-turn-helix transcriptional regulator, partial [Wolbachia endosymbiont of Tyrophagus putrescentiae]|nr:helix-turn-helix transcriptional regulator [Wolbachia endosymbiont of Tyrophagus putrescentiae]
MIFIYDNLETKSYEIGKNVLKTYKNYELEYKTFTVEELYVIARALSVTIIDLLPGPTLLRENSWHEDEDEEILYLTKIYNDQDKIYPLIRWVYVNERIIQEEARIEVARNLVKNGISVDIISRATRLSTYEYEDSEQRKKFAVSYKVGKRIREERLVKRYTQEELANKIGSTTKEIHEYERGYKSIPVETLYKITKVLSVNIKTLFLELKEYDELLELIKHQESMIRSLSKGMHANKEKIQKAEKIKVAKNLVKAGVSVDIICKTT